MTLNGDLGGVIEELQRLRVGCEANVQTHKSALEVAQRELQQVDRLLRAAGITEEKPEKRTVRKTSKGTAETRQRVFEAITRHEQQAQPALPDVPGSFVVTDILGDFHETTVRNVVIALREEGVIRVVGKKPVGRARAPLAYARTQYGE